MTEQVAAIDGLIEIDITETVMLVAFTASRLIKLSRIFMSEVVGIIFSFGIVNF